jgi:hypothetical protein
MKRVLFALAISGCMAVCSADEILYGNLLGDSGSGDWVNTCIPYGYGSCISGTWGPLYNSFSTTAVSTAITDVQVTLTADPNLAAGSFSVGIYADSGSDTPGALIAGGLLTPVGGDPDSVITGGGPTTLDFSGLDVAVNATSTYWIGIGPVGGTSALWDYSDVYVPADQYVSNGTGTFSTSEYTPYIMSVSDQSTPSPEPASALLAGGALMALGLVRRKKKQTLR